MPTRDREIELLKKYKYVIGVDEAGRGCLAGPVVVACCILPKKLDPELLDGIKDSKKLSHKKREHLYEKIIHTKGLKFAIASISPQKIDKLNILGATLHGMRLVIEHTIKVLDLDEHHVYACIDGNILPDLSCDGEAIIKGDDSCVNISAASILAKVWRDRYMCKLSSRYSGWSFSVHKGYPTVKHKDELKKYGVLNKIHRMSYGPVKKFL